MTKINRVTIHGFKSFAHKTDIPFENEFNCILGPNGSGKSNIGDALCFVLGRLSAKSMRAEKAANLIFNGGKSKKPASSGSVEIAFCNKNKVFPIDDKEIVINRQISKKGNSTYRINGNKKTRGEVLDFLGLAKINPDGYNIILQGDITRFVTMSPTERRRIIEEISDVAIYEDKKHKAMLELNKVEEKMNSAEIILKERKTYLKELKKDRDQALKFKSFKDKIDSNKATYLHMQIKDNQEKHQKIEKQIKDHQVKINNFEKKIEQIKVKVNEDKEKISTINKEIEQKGEKGQLEVHREIENLKVTNAQDKTRISTLKDEINKIKQRKDQFQQEIKELENKSSSSLKNQKGLQKEIDRKEKDLIEIKQKIEQFKKKHKIESSQELDKEIEDKDKLIDQKQEEIQKVRQQQQELLREKDRIEYQFETIDEKIKKVKEIKQENKDQIKTLQKHKINFKHSTLRLNKCLENDSSFASQLANARRSLSELHEKQAKLNAKTLTAQASLSANQALQAILNNKNNFSGVHGTVADLGQVKKKYSLALEMTAGGKMQNLVVDNDKTAAECIRHLKVNKLGSASFIPLNKIKYQEINFEQQKLTKIDGVHDFAINLISFKPQYKKAFKNVFGSTLIVENIDIARKVGIGTIKMATLEGNIVEASGVMRGGFIKRRSGIAFKEKDSLEALNKIDNETAEIEGVIHNITNKREANEKEISSLRNLRAELEAEIIKLEKTLHLDTDDLDATSEIKKELSNKLKEVDQELEKIQKQVSLINKELAGLKSKKHMLRSQVNELRNPRLLAQLSAFEESKQQTREAVLKLESDLRNSSTSLEQLYSPELNKIKEIMQQHDKEEIKFKEEIKTLSSKISGNEKELTEKEKESKVFYSKYKQLFNQREKISSDINNSENNIENIREKIRTCEREINLISLKNAEAKAKLAGLKEEFSKYKDTTLLKNKPIEELKKEISKFEVMLSQMSAVNMKALEVYEQVETEFNKLVKKKESLAVEKTDVLTMMNEIETKKKDHFMKTFNHANKNFQEIFNNLFKKGKAHLELDNPNKPFEDGLSIKVKLTGNRFMDIKSLSGGEKTMTALSFIFAIQEYQPASFYILDEIDAALDKHNAETLAKSIRNYSNKAQYIVISHNDAVISEADTLFGISMKEGVSKVTSLKV